MAEVWLAERADGAFERQVAIKLLFRHASSHERDALAQRFARERDILASLRHPNIAALHDAGVTPERPALARARVRRGRAHHGLVRWAADGDSRAHRGVPPGAAGGSPCAHEPRHSPRPEAGQHPRHPRGRGQPARFRHRQADRARGRRARRERADPPVGSASHPALRESRADPRPAADDGVRRVLAGRGALRAALRRATRTSCRCARPRRWSRRSWRSIRGRRAAGLRAPGWPNCARPRPRQWRRRSPTTSMRSSASASPSNPATATRASRRSPPISNAGSTASRWRPSRRPGWSAR